MERNTTGTFVAGIAFVTALLLVWIYLRRDAAARDRSEARQQREHFTAGEADETFEKNLNEYEARLYVINMIEIGKRRRATSLEIDKYQALRNRRMIRRAFRRDTGTRVTAKALREKEYDRKETFAPSSARDMDHGHDDEHDRSSSSADRIVVLRRLREIADAVNDLYTHVEGRGGGGGGGGCGCR